LTSFSQFVQELINGSVRRHVFAPYELELLLDLQMFRIRKSARPDILRRFLRAVQQEFARGCTGPPRLATFLENEARTRGQAALPAQTPVTVRENPVEDECLSLKA